MPAQSNTNQKPYFDDFDELKNFYRILYKPGLPVQARELTQSQSIIQDQIEKLGGAFFKDGDVVVPGEFSLGVPAPYVRVSSITQGSRSAEYVGFRLTGATSGVVAFVNHAEAATDTEDVTFFVTYESSGATGEESTFIEGEVLESSNPNDYTATVGVTSVSKPVTVDVMGLGSLFTVTGGSYFVNGFVVRTDEQTIVLDKFSNRPTCEVGFNVVEEMVDSNDDESLLDNSQGSSNFAAPGADRLKISLVLAQRAFGTEDPSFILLATIQQGNIIGKPDQTIKWKWLYDILAKRTFDESGDYIVRDFCVEPKEYWNNDVVDGVWDPDEYGLYNPLPGTSPDSFLTLDQADDKYALKICPGLAYVQGYEVGLEQPLYVYGDKPREVEFYENSLTQITPGYNVSVTNVYGAPDVQNIVGDGVSVAFDDIITYRTFIDGYVGESTDSDGRPLNYGNKPWTTYHIITDKFNLYTSNCPILGDGEVADLAWMTEEGGFIDADGICGTTTTATASNRVLNVTGQCHLQGDGGLIEEGFTMIDDVSNTDSFLHVDGICVPGAPDPNPGPDPDPDPPQPGVDYIEIFNDGNSLVITSPNEYRRGDTIGNATILVSTKIDPIPSGVIKPRFFKPRARVNNQDGVFGYNSTYDLGVLTSTYFTELNIVDAKTSLAEWVVGDPVYGEESGAVGIVEQGTTQEILLVSNVIGEFIAGEDVTQAGKVARILRDGEIKGFQFPTKGNLDTVRLDGQEFLTIGAIGSTIVLSKADGDFTATEYEISLTTTGRNKLKNFPYDEESGLNERVNFDVVTSPHNIRGYAVLLDAKITNTLGKTKSFFSPLEDRNDFSSDISVRNNSEAEIVDIADSALFSGRAYTNFVTCDSLQGDASEQLVAGDIVTFVDDEGVSNNRVVLFCTKPFGYGSLRSQSRVYFTTTFSNTVTGKAVQRIRVKSQGKPEETLLFQLPHETVATIESNPLKTNINYPIFREFLVDVASGATSFTLTTLRANEQFIPSTVNTSITVSKNNEDVNDAALLEGRHITVDTVNLQDQGKKIVYNLGYDSGLPKSATLKVIVPLQVTDAAARRKNIIRNAVLTTTDADAERRVISLQQSDIYKVTRITYVDGTGVIHDVTDAYLVDNGQRDNHYDIGRLILKPNAPVAPSALSITFDYFEHETEGDFFSVDSYTDDDGVDYGAVPVYVPHTSNVRAKDRATVIQLRDVVDFRPIVNTNPTTGSIIASIVDGEDAQGSKNFKDTNNGGDAFVPRIPVPGNQFECDLQYYLPKVDALFLEKTGAFTLVPGVPSDNPKPPADISTGIRLFNIALPAYTFSVKNTKVRKFNYRVYQMKDIADIHRRLDRVEDLVTLSILEQSALNMSVRDAVTGLDRFKNGIVVDNFSDHSKADVNSSQYRASIDPDHTHMRAPHFTDQVEMEEVNQTDDAREFDGYVNNNGILTLKYDSQEFIYNNYATRTINVQPYSVFTYDGQMSLSPAIDTWQDVTTLPDVVVEDNSLFDALQAQSKDINEFNKDFNIGTVWGDWETLSNQTTSTTTKVGRAGMSNVRTSQQRREVDEALRTVESKGGIIGTPGKHSQNVLDRGLTPPIRVTSEVTTTQQARTGTRSVINVSTGRIENTSYGDRVVDVSLARTMRTVPVIFTASRLKPNTRYYAFFDNTDVTKWCSSTRMKTVFDGSSRFFGSNLQNNKGFGEALVSDSVGNLTGVFLVPNGRCPVQGSVYSQLDKVQYETTGSTRSFPTGTRTFRLSSSASNNQDTTALEGFAESTFTASGVLMDKQETIISTRIPQISRSTEFAGTQNRQQVSETASANYFDPVAQTFLIDSNNNNGVFVTELDVFFSAKDSTQSVEAYLVTTDGEVPTKKIIPHSRVVKTSDSFLRVTCELDAVTGSTAVLAAGTTVVGSTSGATGVVKAEARFEPPSSNPTTNVENHVYDLVLNNYKGEFQPGEAIVPQVAPADLNTFAVVQDEVVVDRVDIRKLGTGYTSPVVVFTEPELVGGQPATGIIKTSSDGKLYDFELISPGSGYTQTPGITILDSNGSGAELYVRTRKANDAVKMGVATSDDAKAATTFRFDAPVYLLGDTMYAFIVKSPNSVNYSIYTSKLGENQLGTNNRVVENPSMGVLFKSANGGLWTEDQTQDITFRLRRAEFDTSTNTFINLQNIPVGTSTLPLDPIETSSQGVSTTSDVFGENPRIVKVHKKLHGLAAGDLVMVDGILGNPGGIANDNFNDIHTVISADFDAFTFNVGSAASMTGRSGGTLGRVTVGKPYEVLNLGTGAMAFANTSLLASVRAAGASGVTGYNSARAYRHDTPVDVNLDMSYYFNDAKQIGGYLNEANFSDDTHLRDKRSLMATIRMGSDDSKVSPVIDMQRTNATVVRNLIDNPSPDDIIFGPESRVLTMANTFSTDLGETLSWVVDGVEKTAKIESYNGTAKKVRLEGDTSGLALASQFTNSTLASNAITKSVTPVRKLFSPETNNFGSVYAKYLSRLFVFENPCDGLEVKLTAVFYDVNDIKVYFRPRTIGFDGDLAEVNWIPFNGTGLANDSDKIEPRSTQAIDPNLIDPGEWSSLTWTTQDTAKFDAVAVKIVMSSENPAKAPLFDDMIVVATE